MNNAEELIRKYLERDLGSAEKSKDCLSDELIMGYFQGRLGKEELERAEKHISGCGFCLSQLNLIYEAEKINKDSNIRVHLLCPGGVNTGMVSRVRPDIQKDELIEPAEIAELVIYLLTHKGNAVIDELRIRRATANPWF